MFFRNRLELNLDQTLQVPKSCCQGVLDDRFEMQNKHPNINKGFLFYGRQNMEKGENFQAAAWQWISSDV